MSGEVKIAEEDESTSRYSGLPICFALFYSAGVIILTYHRSRMIHSLAEKHRLLLISFEAAYEKNTHEYFPFVQQRPGEVICLGECSETKVDSCSR